ncbi:MAG: uracil-DNA glycosylase [Simkania sp.]|nr:uracil-DNA glycosylase [Simkania sp.]
MKMEKDWYAILREEIEQPYVQRLKKFLDQEKAGGKEVYPPESLVFQAFLKTPWERVRVVIVGQDPYHGPRQAQGLSFSVPKGVPLPPSLQNIFKELKDDLGVAKPEHGCLISWAEQGVLLLNATLTVRRGEPQSHAGMGWERFTDVVIDKIASREKPAIFVLWGKSAQEKCQKIPPESLSRHIVLKAAHPSPYSAHQGFFGCKHFSKINQILQQSGQSPIDWTLT